VKSSITEVFFTRLRVAKEEFGESFKLLVGEVGWQKSDRDTIVLNDGSACAMVSFGGRQVRNHDGVFHCTMLAFIIMLVSPMCFTQKFRLS
jgi:hypothetical protein